MNVITNYFIPSIFLE